MDNEKYIKVIVTKGIVEKWTYEYMPIPNRSKTPVKKKTDDEWLDDKQGDKKNNGRRARWKFMRIINNNFDENSKFVTLTFAENITDVEQANYHLTKFIQRLKTHFKGEEIVYVCSIEFQDRGAVHYHLLLNMPYVAKDRLAEIWGHGFVQINKITHVDNVGAYVSKYMTKADQDIRLKGKKAFWTSRNIQKPIDFKGKEAEDLIQIYGIDKRKPVFKEEYNSDHHGTITYEQFNLNREEEKNDGKN